MGFASAVAAAAAAAAEVNRQQTVAVLNLHVPCY